jgi:NitT/TauT family transport system permease protein
MSWLKQRLPVLVVLAGIILLGYPVALVFGLPLALRDMQDLRKWESATFTAQPVADLSASTELHFAAAPERGVLVWNGRPLPWSYAQEGQTVRLAGEPPEGLVLWERTLTPLSSTVYSFGEAIPEGNAQAVYVGTRLAIEGSVPARELADGQRVQFSFRVSDGPIIVDDSYLVEGEDYIAQEHSVTLARAPAFGSTVRRVSGDYAVLNPNEGTILFAEAPDGEVRAAERVVRLAEVLSGEVDGENRRFGLEHGRVVETDRDRAVYVNDLRLSDAPERPQERVDGTRREFTFESERGIVTVDGVPQEEGRDFTRSGSIVNFTRAPARNANLRQHPDFFLLSPEQGEILLAEAPVPGSIVWAGQYTVYAQPGCGVTVLECFYALPQHPVPFPHWIVGRIGPFFQKHPLHDERNIVRATLYTTLGTLSALGLGAAVGIILAVLFVLLRPLEQALLPWVIASQTVPIIALVPVLLLILGNFGITIQTSLLPTAIIGAYIAFFPVVVGTVKGLRSVDPLALDLMKSYAATPAQVFTKVRFPAAAPFFFTSLKLGTAAALVGALVAETESNNRRGLGFQILGQVQSGNVADVWILLIISALLGIGLVALIGFLQRLVAPWERA